jgi:magnesium chelatase family protein
VPAVPQDDLLKKADGKASTDLQARVEIARQRQLARQDKANALLSVTKIDELCAPDEQGVALLQQAISRLNLSARAYHRVLKVHAQSPIWKETTTLRPDILPSRYSIAG